LHLLSVEEDQKENDEPHESPSDEQTPKARPKSLVQLKKPTGFPKIRAIIAGMKWIGLDCCEKVGYRGSIIIG
jgi:hypothetical protein